MLDVPCAEKHSCIVSAKCRTAPANQHAPPPSSRSTTSSIHRKHQSLLPSRAPHLRIERRVSPWHLSEHQPRPACCELSTLLEFLRPQPPDASRALSPRLLAAFPSPRPPTSQTTTFPLIRRLREHSRLVLLLPPPVYLTRLEHSLPSLSGSRMVARMFSPLPPSPVLPWSCKLEPFGWFLSPLCMRW